jgi:DNA topoisomerase-1
MHKPTEAIRPTSINRDPSEIPKPVRQLYRMIWARTLAACSISAKVRQEIASFKVDGVSFEAEGLEVVDPGYDRVGLGQFLRKQVFPPDLKFEAAHAIKGSWSTEAEFIEALAPMKLDSPAYVIKALENNDYIEFDGTRIVPTKLGLEMLTEVKQVMPEFASPMFFTQVEYRLRQVAKGSFKRRPVLAEYEGWLKEKVRLLDLPSL